ncbi:MAG: DUF2125 domain-containing protein [Pseudomonadota bacterium]
MSPRAFSMTPLALTFLSAPSIAFADLTAQDVWDDFQNYLTSFGYEISGTETQSGDVLTVTNVLMTLPMTQEGLEGSTDVEIPEMVFSGQSDGTVVVDIAPNTSITQVTKPEFGDELRMSMDYVQEGFEMSASGSPDNIAYAYSAERAVATITELMTEGSDLMSSDNAKMEFVLSGMAGTSGMQLGETRIYEQMITADELAYEVVIDDPEGDGTVNLKGMINDLSMDGDGVLPIDGTDVADISAMLSDGFEVDGSFNFGGGQMAMAFTAPDGSGAVNTASTGGLVRVKMSGDGLGYTIENRNQQVTMTLPDVPFPVNFSMAQSVVDLLVPVQKSDEAQDVDLTLKLDDFAMADQLWALFDPTATLPRDPADLTIDLSGKALVLFDFLDPEQMATLEETGAMPGEFQSVTINEVLLNVAGAKLTGSGSFDLDNSDTQTFGGIPRPTGSMDVALEGANGLIDNLVAIGLLPEDQAMGARMMMGLFAVPGEGEDTLTSKIEINQEGHVLANGQRIQ